MIKGHIADFTSDNLPSMADIPNGHVHDAWQSAPVEPPLPEVLIHGCWGEKAVAWFEKFRDGDMQRHAQIKAHWLEVAVEKQTMRLNPDWDDYITRCRNNKLVLIYAMAGEDLVGYAIFFVNRHLHYRDLLISNDDAYYVDPKYRKVGLGSRMIEHGEKVLREVGVQFSMLRTKHGAAHAEFLERLGYKPMDIVYRKVLEP